MKTIVTLSSGEKYLIDEVVADIIRKIEKSKSPTHKFLLTMKWMAYDMGRAQK